MPYQTVPITIKPTTSAAARRARKIALLDGVTVSALSSLTLLVWSIAHRVSLGQLPGKLARKWGHPQASAINVAGSIGMATGGLLWPLALIWAFITPSESDVSRIEDDRHGHAFG